MNLEQELTDARAALTEANVNESVPVAGGIRQLHSAALELQSQIDAVRVALAVSLFRNGAVSAGFAARMAGKPLPDLLALLSSLGIPLAGGAADGHDDMNTARQWLDQTSSSPTPDR